MEHHLVIKKMARLKLSGMAEMLDQRLDQAMKEQWAYSTLLEMLLTDEIEQRNQRQLTKRLAKSRLDLRKTMETFDFEFNPSIPAALFRELATCAFVEKKQNVFIVGQSGVGKSHLAQALGHQACRREHDVLCYSATEMLDWIHSGRGDGTHKRRLDQMIKVPILLIDDLGLQPLLEQQQGDLYQLIAARYEKNSTILTSNRDTDEWAAIFSNPLLGTAAVDRLVHRGILIAIKGPSHRLEEFKKTCEKLETSVIID